VVARCKLHQGDDAEFQGAAMASLTVGIVDVFAETPLTGNPLAVVEGAEALGVEVLRSIAREFNQAETTFILPSTRADFRLRSFTAAGVEVFGAGHNALGAWLWLGLNGALGSLEPGRTFHQEIGAEVLPIRLEQRAGRLLGRMRQSDMQLGEHEVAAAAIAAALSIAPSDVLADPAPRAVSTGVSHLMVRLTGAEAVDRCAPDGVVLKSLLRAAGAEGCYVYGYDEGRAHAHARFFNPTVGLWEDAATGTAAGPLAAYLAFTKHLPTDRLTILQGATFGRPSRIEVTLTPVPELSGSGLIVLKGSLEI
jgi:PhzF family phenazine biosynthesis protein